MRPLLLAALLAGCVTDWRNTPTIWPPDDFELQVQSSRLDGEDFHIDQRFRVWADGHACYREADRMLRGEFLELPVFERISIYRMHAQSTRSLARQLHLARITELKSRQGTDDREAQGVAVGLRYRAFDRERYLLANGRPRATMARLLHIVNAYLPPDHAFTLAKMGGEPLDPRLEEVPAPAVGREAALEGHLILLEHFPEDEELLVSAFALTVGTERRELRDRLLERIETLRGVRDRPFPDEPDAPSYVDMLREFVAGPPASRDG